MCAAAMQVDGITLVNGFVYASTGAQRFLHDNAYRIGDAVCGGTGCYCKRIAAFSAWCRERRVGGGLVDQRNTRWRLPPISNACCRCGQGM